jgi:hypothetical protein
MNLAMRDGPLIAPNASDAAETRMKSARAAPLPPIGVPLRSEA